ncbi:ATP-binding protein [Rhizorhabdus dicambivorans]|uniref:histidine kinase n=1 Tax=Rhizorhabdus dicambivorans TaxID=1850238 RepID=A0A2A4G0J3_9SPHN|nr:ATP-binding protein [Rhizorhabdus dicambivorans]ATE63045.1 hybrid sensor histidine kinase/response regulator [Rhizorhabdus dicambivorans]PCE43222.1 hybrid sensor histidine kinase/response regulator [Rhizorhabdus dicambivorans]
MPHRTAKFGHRVLVAAPYGRDAESVAGLLRREGHDVAISKDLASIADRLDDHLGAVILTEEALGADRRRLRAALDAQPAWSDVPFIVLAARRMGPLPPSQAAVLRISDVVDNFTVFERPLSSISLLSAVRSALRSRQKQFEMRDHLAEIGARNAALARSEEELRAARDILARNHDQLEAMVARRTEELRRAQEHLHQSQKMEAVGQLTGGIAHDFNNMLTGIIGAMDIMRRRIATGRFEGIERYMDAATTSANRAAGLTQRLLAFSRRQSLDSRPVDVNALIGTLGDLLVRTIGEQVALETRLDPTIPAGIADANQLESAILNLAINARDAMPEGGTLSVATSCVGIDPAIAAGMADAKPGRYVVVTVRDTGVGMPPELLDKVFEPFFTTKPLGQGTGLGLSMVYGFAQQNGGHVTIDSTPGKGTAVSIYLPATERAGIDAGQEMPRAPQGAGQQVLVVEDDPSVRLLIRDVLEEVGYAAIEARDGQEAVPILESDIAIDLMISDVGLPGMNGRQLADTARLHRPDLPILFVTGYAENAAIRSGFLGANMGMITKPFSLDDLGRKIDEILAPDRIAAG